MYCNFGLRVFTYRSMHLRVGGGVEEIISSLVIDMDKMKVKEGRNKDTTSERVSPIHLKSDIWFARASSDAVSERTPLSG